MKRTLLFLFLAFVHFLNATTPVIQNKNTLCFTENKGQIGDQNHKPRPDVLFGGNDGQLTFHLKSNGISYQQYRVDSWKTATALPNGLDPISEIQKDKKIPNQITIYRLDINWLNVNAQTVIKHGEQLPGYSNFYNENALNGALEVKAYNELTYQNIYNGIDLKWYQKNGHLKYDYIISAGADYKEIKIEYNGAQKLSVNSAGELIIITPLGQIVEQAPYVTQNGEVLKSQWKINNNIVSFNIENYNSALPLLIDPGVRNWGTYYGGNNNDLCWASVSDASGNLFMTGYTSSVGGTNIATVGSHQSAHSGNGLENSMVAKFTSLGVRLWATYYGGNGRDIGAGCAVDASGSIFLVGNTVSTNIGAIATVGSHQSTPGGDWDAYIVKFNSAGVRQWGTYYGGSGIDNGNSCATDAQGNVYLCGKANAAGGTVIATPGSFQPAYGGNEDAFLVKFDPNGVRIWGTFYGVEGSEAANKCATDPLGNIYMVGYTSSTVNMVTPGTHQTIYGGGYDGFLAKFNSNGVRLLATYYGGPGDDKLTGFCRNSSNGNLHVSGLTFGSGANSIATDGSHQSANGGGTYDAFLAQFNSNGIRQWGTYYGGTGDDRGNSCALNQYGYVYLAGYTASNAGTVIATAAAHQTVYGGGTFDAFLVQFNSLGTRMWGTYYGGPGFDLGYGCSTDNNSNVYLVGLSDCLTGTTIASAGGHQTSYGGLTSDGFIAQFFDCAVPPAPGNATPIGNQTICLGNTATISANGIGAINWYTVPNGGTSLSTGTNYITPVLSAGNYTFYAEANTCTTSALRVPVSLTVFALPNLTVTSSNSLTLCPGQSATLTASGAASYSWNFGANGANVIVTPTISETYTVLATDANGCSNNSVFTQSVTICTGLIQQTLLRDELYAFPNPTNSSIILKGAAVNSKIIVYNLLGEILISDTNENLKSEITLTDYANGIYFIKVLENGKQQTIKVIKN